MCIHLHISPSNIIIKVIPQPQVSRKRRKGLYLRRNIINSLLKKERQNKKNTQTFLYLRIMKVLRVKTRSLTLMLLS
jgi:hypothetical protein